MKLTVKSDAHQFLLLEGPRTVGHYTTVLGLLEGARRAIRKDRTKSGAALTDLIENGIRHEEQTLNQLRALAQSAAALPQPGVG